MIYGRLCLALAFVAATAACAAQTGDEGSTESAIASARAVSTPSGLFTVALASANPTVDLGQKVDVDVVVTPAAGFTGTVTLNVTGLSAGVTAAPVSVALDAGATQARLTLTADLTAHVTPKNATVPIAVVGTAGSESATVETGFKVLPKLTLFIPNNITALYTAPGGPLREEWGTAFGPNNKPLRTQRDNGIVVTIFNKDSKPHTIHGPGGNFPHGDSSLPIQANAFELLKNGNVRTRTIQVGDSITGYCHGEPKSENASFKITVAATP